MNDNGSFHRAREAKNDEWFTPMNLCADELKHYKEHFKGKTVLCNCDDPAWSSFWKYFHLNFKELGLKKLISTHYDRKNPTYKLEYEGGNDNDTSVGIKTPLDGNGDFMNAECVEILKSADIVATNPPFSLLRSYIRQLMEYDKKFIIIANQNAISYKEVFPLIRDNKIWLGVHAGDMAFMVPKDTKPRPTRYWQDSTGQKWRSLGNGCWFTNLDIRKRHEDLILWKDYSPEEYPKYENYDAINVGKYSEIPRDYNGVMGVPITFLDKYNPDQFIILGIDKDLTSDHNRGLINGKRLYARLFIKKKEKVS